MAAAVSSVAEGIRQRILLCSATLSCTGEDRAEMTTLATLNNSPRSVNKIDDSEEESRDTSG